MWTEDRECTERIKRGNEGWKSKRKTTTSGTWTILFFYFIIFNYKCNLDNICRLQKWVLLLRDGRHLRKWICRSFSSKILGSFSSWKRTKVFEVLDTSLPACCRYIHPKWYFEWTYSRRRSCKWWSPRESRFVHHQSAASRSRFAFLWSGMLLMHAHTYIYISYYIHARLLCFR